MRGIPFVQPASVLLLIVFAAQIAFGVMTKSIRPHWEILDPPMSGRALDAAGFGDSQLLYRILVMELQNAGDDGGRVTPIRDYDVGTVVQWMEMLDLLDFRAHHHIGLALRYFSLNQDKPRIEPLVRYAMRHVDRDPQRKLDWLSQALMMTEVRLKDQALAIEIAEQMASYDFPEINPIAYQIAPVLHEKAGDLEKALSGMERALAKTRNRASPEEIAYMEAFIASVSERLGKTTVR